MEIAMNAPFKPHRFSGRPLAFRRSVCRRCWRSLAAPRIWSAEGGCHHPNATTIL